MGGDVPGVIPWSLVAAWAELHGLTRGEFRFLDRCLQAMDESFREWWRSKQPETDDKGTPREIRRG